MKKKVLFIIWSYSYGGGAEKILSNIVNNIDENKYEVHILEYCYAGIKKEETNENIILHKPIINIEKKTILNKMKNTIIDRILIKICPSIIRKIYLNQYFDVEISFNYLIPTFLLNKKCPKKISWIHGSVEDLKDNKYMKYKQKNVFKKVQKIITISKKTYESIIELFPEQKDKTEIINNGFKIKDIIKKSEEEVIEEKTDILFCGRFDKNKNPMKLLEISRILKEFGKNYTIGFLGQGEMLEEMNTYIEKNNLQENIRIFGYQQNPYTFIKNTKILCLTSYSEGFPTVIVEAMVLGKPFISTPVAGTEELSDYNKCGFVCKNNEEYAKKIIELLSKKDVYDKMSDNCKKHVKNFVLEKQIKKIEKLIDEV